MITFEEFILLEQEVKDSVMFIEIDEGKNLFESILPSQAISTASKKDIRKMSRANLNKILDKFAQLVNLQYSKKGTKKQKYLGRVRYLTSNGVISEFPVKSLSKDAYLNSLEDGDKIVAYDKSKRKLRVEIGNDDWRTIPLDNVMGLIFKGKVFSLEDITRNDGEDDGTQSSKISNFVDNQAKQTAQLKNKLFKIMDEFNFYDVPKETTEALERKMILRNMKKPKTDNIYKVVDKHEPKGSYDVSLKSYNRKSEIVKLDFKLNKKMILDFYGVETLTKSKIESDYDKKSWYERIEEIKNDIKQKFSYYGLDAKIGVDWIKGTI